MRIRKETNRKEIIDSTEWTLCCKEQISIIGQNMGILNKAHILNYWRGLKCDVEGP